MYGARFNRSYHFPSFSFSLSFSLSLALQHFLFIFWLNSKLHFETVWNEKPPIKNSEIDSIAAQINAAKPTTS